jgi:hypothetical protein
VAASPNPPARSAGTQRAAAATAPAAGGQQAKRGDAPPSKATDRNQRLGAGEQRRDLPRQNIETAAQGLQAGAIADRLLGRLQEKFLLAAIRVSPDIILSGHEDIAPGANPATYPLDG